MSRPDEPNTTGASRAPRPARSPRRQKQPHVPLSRRAKIWIAVSVVAAIAVTAVQVQAVGTVIRAYGPQESVADQVDVVAGSPTAPTDGRGAVYSLGHTVVGVPLGQGSGTQTTSQRVPFRMSATATAFRVVISNSQYIDDSTIPGSVDIDTVYVGPARSADSGSFAEEPIRIAGETTLDEGDALSTGWFDAEQMQLSSGTDYLLSMAWTSAATQPIAATGNVSWLQVGASAASAGARDTIGTFSMAGSFFDIDIEYRYDEPRTSVAVMGHSLNSGANARAAEHPHDGEESAWHQQWADEYNGVSSSFSVPGSWTPQFTADSSKWALTSDVDADVFALWASSSDLVSGTTPDIVRGYWQSVIDQAKATWPGVRIVAFTEPPRGATGVGETYRTEWNDWLRSTPSAYDALVDADALLQDPADPTVLSPEHNGDDSHFAPSGHAVIADAFEEAIEPLGL